MALLSKEVPIQDFIKITNAGVDIADFVQIRAAVIKRYKDVYGSDIDVSTATADGVFINDLCLIINNILQSVRTLYSNLDVNTASGVYLDRLCRLSNVVRKSATHSTTTINVQNVSDAPIDIIASTAQDGTIFADQAGNEWYCKQDKLSYDNQIVATIEPNQEYEIQVYAKDEGPIEAKAGWINLAIGEQYLIVTQPNDAILGERQETDSQLRARRAQSVGAAGTTVLDSLVGALLSLSSIRDVKIYNNNQAVSSDSEQSEMTTKDGVVLNPHSVYIILRRLEGILLDADDATGSSTIGSIIYNKMTPGIQTTNASQTTSGAAKSYEYLPIQTSGLPITVFSQVVYWKEATPISPDIDISITVFPQFSEEYFESIIQELCEYLNSLPLSQNIQKNQILVEAMNADPTFKGAQTYVVNSVVFESNVNEIVNPDTYFKYSPSTSSYELTSSVGSALKSYVIKLRGE